MLHCPKQNTPTGIGVAPHGGLVTASKLGCKMWNCPYCSIKRKQYLGRKAYFGVQTYKAQGIEDWYFGTVTMHENWRGWASVENFQRNWNKFYQRMKRETERLMYVLLPEKHKDGSLHIHLISTCGADTRWFKDNGRSCGFGFKNENTPLENTGKAAYYVTKYVGKSLGHQDWPLRFRRCRFSVGWPDPPTNSEFLWHVVLPTAAAARIRTLRDLGYEVINTHTGDLSVESPLSKEKRIEEETGSTLSAVLARQQIQSSADDARFTWNTQAEGEIISASMVPSTNDNDCGD